MLFPHSQLGNDNTSFSCSEPGASAALAEQGWLNNLPGSALPAQWARGHREDETGEVPAESPFSSRHCTVTPGKTVAWVYSFCEDPGGCFFYILIPASYLLQDSRTFPPSFSGGCYFYSLLQGEFSQPKSSVMCQRDTAGGKLTTWTGGV